MTQYKIISKDHPNELWASGFSDKFRAEAHIPNLRRHMYPADRSKELIVVEEGA